MALARLSGQAEAARLDEALRPSGLKAACGLDRSGCAARDDLPPGTATLLLLSPDEPAFWPVFTASPEWHDGAPDPMDRWSLRVIGDLAAAFGATALFPFGGPPWQPFIAWARASGRVHGSPLGMLVSPGAGLFTSFRGALALPRALPVPTPTPRPCDACAAPCADACPVGALTRDGYDTARCAAHLARPEGRDCRDGCLARRACPVADGSRLPAHSAYHMAKFLEARCAD